MELLDKMVSSYCLKVTMTNCSMILQSWTQKLSFQFVDLMLKSIHRSYLERNERSLSEKSFKIILLEIINLINCLCSFDHQF